MPGVGRTSPQTPSRSPSPALRSKERTNAELTAWLDRRGYGAEEIEAAVGHLTEVGELDDERFARRYAEDKRELRGWGAERIREALLARGVAPSLAEAAVEADSHEAQVHRARDLLTGAEPSPWRRTPIERGRSAT